MASYLKPNLKKTSTNLKSVKTDSYSNANFFGRMFPIKGENSGFGFRCLNKDL